jgi:hypothetical protein
VRPRGVPSFHRPDRLRQVRGRAVSGRRWPVFLPHVSGRLHHRYWPSRRRSTACDACSPGQYSNSSALEKCIDCAAGSITDTGSSAGASTCGECSVGQYSTSSAVFVCRVCKPAKYQSSAGQTSCFECNGCFAGSERRACGGSYEGYCVDCAPGWFVNSSKCLECPGGYYQTSLNQRNCTQCARCPSGGTRQQCGLSFEGYCAECIPGKFTSSTSGSEACQSCSAGQYQPDLDQSNCILCPAGKHQDEAGKPFCKLQGIQAGRATGKHYSPDKEWDKDSHGREAVPRWYIQRRERGRNVYLMPSRHGAAQGGTWAVSEVLGLSVPKT